MKKEIYEKVVAVLLGISISIFLFQMFFRGTADKKIPNNLSPEMQAFLSAEHNLCLAVFLTSEGNYFLIIEDDPRYNSPYMILGNGKKDSLNKDNMFSEANNTLSIARGTFPRLIEEKKIVGVWKINQPEHLEKMRLFLEQRIESDEFKKKRKNP